MAAPEYTRDPRDYYQRRQDDKRPTGRRAGENRVAHRKRMKTERRNNAPTVALSGAARRLANDRRKHAESYKRKPSFPQPER